MEKDNVHYEFDEMLVEGKAHVAFYHPTRAANLTVYAREITGDKTGVIRLSARQRLFVFIVQSTHTYMDAPCGFYVDNYAELILPTEVILRGEETTLLGRVTGIESLVIERNGMLIVQGSAHTAKLADESKWFESNPFYPFTPGWIQIPKVKVTNKGSMKIDMNPVDPQLDIGELSIKKGENYNRNTCLVAAKLRPYLDDK